MTGHKSRTYCVMMSHSVVGDVVIISSTTYKAAAAYLSHCEKQWKAMRLEVERNRTELKAEGELGGATFAAKIWFTENKQDSAVESKGEG